MLTFYYGSGSPYAWRVWLALEFKQVEYRLVVLSFSGGDLAKPDFSALNPRKKVPVLVDEGYALFESAAIVEYLEDRFADRPTLFPGDPRRRGTIRRLVREADGYFAPAEERLVAQVLFTAKENWSEEKIARAREQLGAELARFEDYFTGDWLAGEFSAADLTLYPLVALSLRTPRRKPDLDLDRLIGPKLRAWMRRVESLPYFDKTYPPHWREKS